VKGREVGFAVIYRMKVRAGMERQFVEGWTRLTHAIRERRGGLGSRLHRAGDGVWVAYAQWPSREAWEQASAQESADPDASALMREAVESAEPPILLEPKVDLLMLAPIRRSF
jgi:heme-degrading monooxygenase HmoA